MHVVPLTDITVLDDRIRKTFDEDKIAELAESIETIGLLHAPVVQSDGKTLVAGERRLRALRKLFASDPSGEYVYNGESIPRSHVPVILLADLGVRGVKEAELHENVRRVHLSWQEKAAAVEALHKLRIEQAAERGETHTMRDTAAEIVDKPKEQVSNYRDTIRDLIVAQYIDDPDVQAAPDRNAALQIIERKLEKEKNALLAREALSRGYGAHQIIVGDMRVEIPKLEQGSIDCIITDPPYGVNAETWPNMKAIPHDYQDGPQYSREMFKALATLGWQVTKPQAHLYTFCAVENFFDIRSTFEAVGWYVWATPLIWYKGNMGVAPRPSHGPRRTYEVLLYAIKGDKTQKQLGHDVLTIPHDSSVERGAHKPPALYEELLTRSCYPGDTVLDPFCGTGPIFVAAKRLNMTAIGFDVDEAAIGIAFERLRNDNASI